MPVVVQDQYLLGIENRANGCCITDSTKVQENTSFMKQKNVCCLMKSFLYAGYYPQETNETQSTHSKEYTESCTRMRINT